MRYAVYIDGRGKGDKGRNARSNAFRQRGVCRYGKRVLFEEAVQPRDRGLRGRSRTFKRYTQIQLFCGEYARGNNFRRRNNQCYCKRTLRESEMTERVIIIRYAEIHLKGKNRVYGQSRTLLKGIAPRIKAFERSLSCRKIRRGQNRRNRGTHSKRVRRTFLFCGLKDGGGARFDL